MDYYSAGNIEKAIEIFYMKHLIKDKNAKDITNLLLFEYITY